MAASASAHHLPPSLQHLEDEHLASISFAKLSQRDRETLERLLSASVVEEPELQENASCGAGAVHYFQSYCVDLLGAPSAVAAAAMPQPQYDRLFNDPLPRAPMPAATLRPQRRNSGFQGRYFDAPEEAGTPGVLSDELRSLLGMGPTDPPPYLRRMQELGYPPGYVGVPTPAANGGDAGAAGVLERPLAWHLEAGMCAPGAAPSDEGPAAAPVPLVSFPGLNAPPPDGADHRAWDWRGPITRVAMLQAAGRTRGEFGQGTKRRARAVRE